VIIHDMEIVRTKGENSTTEAAIKDLACSSKHHKSKLKGSSKETLKANLKSLNN